MRTEVIITVELPDEPPEGQMARLRSLATQLRDHTRFRTVTPQWRGWFGYAASVWEIRGTHPVQIRTVHGLTRTGALRRTEEMLDAAA